jgi:chaperonin GroEL
VRISANQTVISAGGGDPAAVAARREQVMRQVELAPPNIERDKLQERLARLAGGAAMIRAGGATPVEQKRHAQLIEDAINAARAAAQDGIVAGGGTALLQIAPELDDLTAGLSGSERIGATMLRSALEQPLTSIAANAGRDAAAIEASASMPAPARSPRCRQPASSIQWPSASPRCATPPRSRR